jgi:hypothetical protein
MSISKIESKIKLLEEKLKEIDTTITDSIERNEYKVELQKEIKKLTRTKNNSEQLQLEQQELESLKTEFLIYEQEPNKKQYTQQLLEISLTTEQKNPKENKDNIPKQMPSDWDVPVISNHEDWTDDSDNSATSENLIKFPKKPTTHLIYLSKRAIWISCVFAIFNFIFPYIYTRRWKPFFILITALVSTTIFISDESTLVAAPWISAIDNGIAIGKSKSKVKHKLS